MWHILILKMLMISIILNSMLMVANNPCVVFFLDRF